MEEQEWIQKEGEKDKRMEERDWRNNCIGQKKLMKKEVEEIDGKRAEMETMYTGWGEEEMVLENCFELGHSLFFELWKAERNINVIPACKEGVSHT